MCLHCEKCELCRSNDICLDDYELDVVEDTALGGEGSDDNEIEETEEYED